MNRGLVISYLIKIYFFSKPSRSIVKMAKEKELNMTQMTMLESQKTLNQSEDELGIEEDENMISYSVL